MTPKGPFISPAPHRAPTPEELQAARDFHLAYYDGWSERRTLDLSWFGYRAIKCPMDLWIYQEIIYETEPEVIVETGTHGGGSALFLAHMCDLANRGRVISVDIVDWPDLLDQRPIVGGVDLVSFLTRVYQEWPIRPDLRADALRILTAGREEAA